MASIIESGSAQPPVEDASLVSMPIREKPKRGYLGTSDDLAHGQVVIVSARWILIVASLILVLWDPGPLSQLRLEVLVLLVLAVVNFYLHAQILMRRPAIDLVVYGASIADLTIISVLVASEGGFTSNIFVFYFPALMALAVAFPTFMTLLYGGGAMAAYGLICAATMSATEGNWQIVLARILMLAAVAVCGNMYWRIERDRRSAAVKEREQLRMELRAPATPPAA